MDKSKASYKFGKLVVSFLGTTVGVYVLVILIILLVLGSIIGTNAESVEQDGESYTIKEELIENYREIQNNLNDEQGVKIPLKYIYAVDAVIREGDFSSDTAKVEADDLTCLYDAESKTVYSEEDKRDVYNCFDYSNYEIQLFEFSVELYSTIGDNDSDAVFAGSFIRPTEAGTITNEFGGYDALGTGHTGIDIANSRGTPIYPSANGKVIRVASSSEGGNSVSILHKIDDIDYVTYYGHLDQPSNVSEGDEVNVNDQIGVMGDTGLATGVHLHFEIMVDTKVVDHSKAVNPREYIDFPNLGDSYNDRGEIGGDISAEKQAIMKAGGVAEKDYSYADYIISHESSWNFLAVNASSGAYGLCQALPPEKLAQAGDDWRTNPITQMKWCDGYAEDRYGSWENAYNWWVTNHWW